MGLLARTVEAHGMATVSISLARDLTETVGVPRALFVKWPLGHPLGEPHHPAQQRTVLFETLRLLVTVDTAGAIHEPGFRWRREQYTEPKWEWLGSPAAPQQSGA